MGCSNPKCKFYKSDEAVDYEGDLEERMFYCKACGSPASLGDEREEKEEGKS